MGDSPSVGNKLTKGRRYRLAISLACRPLHLNGKPFPQFKHFLVESLRLTAPGLAGRIALFPIHEWMDRRFAS